jgi:uncharacterized membrane protein
MDHERAKLLFLMMPFLVITVVGLVLVLYASTSFSEEGKGTVFYNPLGVPGILAVLIGLAGLLLLKFARAK